MKVEEIFFFIFIFKKYILHHKIKFKKKLIIFKGELEINLFKVPIKGDGKIITYIKDINEMHSMYTNYTEIKNNTSITNNQKLIALEEERLSGKAKDGIDFRGFFCGKDQNTMSILSKDVWQEDSKSTEIGWKFNPNNLGKISTRYQRIFLSYSQNDFFPLKEQRIKQIPKFENECKENWILPKNITNIIANHLKFHELLGLSSTCKSLFNILSHKNAIWANFFKANTKIFEKDRHSNIDFDSLDGPDDMSWKEALLNKINCKVEVILVLSDSMMQQINKKEFEEIKEEPKFIYNPRIIYPFMEEEQIILEPLNNSEIIETILEPLRPLDPQNETYDFVGNTHQRIQKSTPNLLALSDHLNFIKDEEKSPTLALQQKPPTQHAKNMTIKLPHPMEQIEAVIVVATVGSHSYFRKINYKPRPYSSGLCD